MKINILQQVLHWQRFGLTKVAASDQMKVQDCIQAAQIQFLDLNRNHLKSTAVGGTVYD